MSSFTNDLIVKSVSSKSWELVSEFIYYFDEERKHFAVKVPEGFCTDFASIPKFLWSILPPIGRHTKAAVLHDFLYSTRCPLFFSRTFYRRDCDLEFLNAMKVLGVSKWRRTAMYLGVRLFGAKNFRK